jgi:NRPS condensation-like uncharacterized protein
VVQRVPFNIVDQWIVHLDQEPEPWSVHCEVRVPGRLDGERLAVAARAAAARHPMARARMASSRFWDRRYCWEITDPVDHLALEIVDCRDDAALAAARNRLESMHVTLASSPPFALTLAHHPRGDALMINLHHAAADGISAYRLLTSIARAYAGVDDPVPDVDPSAARDLRGQFGTHALSDAVARAKQLRARVLEIRSEGAPARIARAGGVEGAEGYHFHLVRLGTEETAHVMGQRRRPATVNDLLVAALAVAIRRFNAERGVTTGRVSAMMPVNLRPQERFEEVVGNILSFVSVSVLEREQSDLEVAQLAVAARTRALKDQRLSPTMIDVLGLSRPWPVGLRHLLARTLRHPVIDKAVDTMILSNLGPGTVPLDFGAGAGAATEIWFSPPGQIPLGTAIGAATMNNELFLTIRSCRAQHDPAGAAALASTWREVLLGR